MTLDELRAKRADLRREIEAHEAKPPSPGRRERIGNLRNGVAVIDDEIAEQESRHREVERLGNLGEHREEPTASLRRATLLHTDREPGGEARDEARRAIEASAAEIDASAAERLETVVLSDRWGFDSRYIAAVSSDAYERAFTKKLAGLNGAEAVLDAEETEAMRTVGRAMAERAMGISEGGIGGYAVPFAFDPTIALISDGAVNPIRQLASVATVTAPEWRGVTSAGVEARFHPEATEAEDDSPELAQPTVKPEKAFAWIPFSFELGEDWAGIRTELSRLMIDAKDVLEAEKFHGGTGEDEPEGLLKGASETVTSKEAGKLTVDDAYTTAEKLPPRFQPNATWQTSLAIANAWHRATGPGSEEPSVFNDAGDRLLRKPWRENSEMESKIEPGNWWPSTATFARRTRSSTGSVPRWNWCRTCSAKRTRVQPDSAVSTCTSVPEGRSSTKPPRGF